jgi:uncharacterized cupin superfamily protein
MSGPSIHILSPEDLPHTPSLRRSDGEELGLVANLGALAGFRNLQLQHELLLPGRRSSPPHFHSEKEEGVLVLKGVVVAVLGEEVFQVGPGKIVLFAPGSEIPHHIENRSEEGAEILTFGFESTDDKTSFGDG